MYAKDNNRRSRVQQFNVLLMLRVLVKIGVLQGFNMTGRFVGRISI